MTLEELIRLSKSYANLGGAIQEQLDTVVEDDMNEDNINLNALDYIRGWLQDADGIDPELSDDIGDVLDRIHDYENEAQS